MQPSSLPVEFHTTPWDSHVFGIPTYEISPVTPQALLAATETPGHYTIRIDPLADKQLLAEYGFYYCDTLVEPFCTPERLKEWHLPDIKLDATPKLRDLLAISQNAFQHGRFHRDFALPKVAAEQRYANWLTQLAHAGDVFSLLYQDSLIGFIAVKTNKLVLHAIDAKWRGKGLAKYAWFLVCQHLFTKGYSEITSSVSASNVAVVNLYASLGFRLRHPVDIYHRLTCKE